jgi:hypothetical protein
MLLVPRTRTKYTPSTMFNVSNVRNIVLTLSQDFQSYTTNSRSMLAIMNQMRYAIE